jgi:hypothetical protein
MLCSLFHPHLEKIKLHYPVELISKWNEQMKVNDRMYPVKWEAKKPPTNKCLTHDLWYSSMYVMADGSFVWDTHLYMLIFLYHKRQEI